METEKPKGIYKKLLKIQQTIHGLGKDKAGLNYKYVTGDKLLGEVKPLMNELGIILKQEVISIENTRQDYKVGKGNDIRDKSEINSKVMMRFTWVDTDSGEKDENLWGANGQNDWDKGVGSAMTYGERYFLLKFFHIATDEDDIDNPDSKKREPEAKSNGVSKPEAKKEVPAEKKWLKVWADDSKKDFSKEGFATVKKLNTGEVTIETVEKFYKLTDEVKAFLLTQYQEPIAP